MLHILNLSSHSQTPIIAPWLQQLGYILNESDICCCDRWSLLGMGRFPVNGLVCCVLRPVWVACIISQVQDVASYVVFCGEIRQYPRFFGSGHLQAAHWTVSALPAPADTERVSACTEASAGSSYRSLCWRVSSHDRSTYHLSMHFWQKLWAQGRMRSAFPSMQIQHSSSSVSCFTLRGHTNRKQTINHFLKRTQVTFSIKIFIGEKMICLRENKPPWLKMIPKNQTFTLLLQIQKCGTHQLSKP